MFVAPARAQVIETSAGASSLLDAYGASTTLYFADNTFTVGSGISHGHLVASASDAFEFKSFDITAGDKSFTLASLSTGLLVNGRGLFVGKHDDAQSVEVFAASCGRVWSAPYFAGFETNKFCTGIRYAHKFERFEVQSVESVIGDKFTALESAAYRWHAVRLSGTGGLLNSEQFLNGDASVTTTHFFADAQRQTYTYESKSATVDSFSVGGTVGLLNVHASEYIAGHASGYAVGASARFWILEPRADYLRSNGQSIISTSISEQVTQRLRVTEYVNTSAGRTAVTFGGSYRARRATVGAEYSTQFLPFVGRFENVLTASVSMQLPHSLTLNASTVTAPDGSSKWTAYGGSYLQGKYAGGLSRSTSATVGKYVVNVQAVDNNGQPVEGVTVYVGRDVCVTNAAGRCFVRTRKPTERAVRVVPEEFAVPGLWSVVTAPASVKPTAAVGDCIVVTVRRQS